MINSELRPLFPFAALIGQERLQQTLLLSAIDPGIGGVLIQGPRGGGKSTSARALAELLPEGCLITLPLGASEEQLIGSLDLERVLQDGRVRFRPGLLAKAHKGVLYVDEVNLLPDHLIDQMLDVAASGMNIVERDGVSHQHPTRFALIGTMNPDEGELRPQLLDRFGLALPLENCFEPAIRQQIVKSRLAFDADPLGFRQGFETEQQRLIQGIAAARSRLDALVFSDAVHERVSACCIAARVDGLRADLVILRAARALAAWQADPAIEPAHVDAVAELALWHRRHPQSERTETSPPPDAAPENDTADDATAASEEAGDWGELPPQPAPIAAVTTAAAPWKKKR